MISLILAWRPFLDPINLHSTWWILIIPLMFGISVVYKAIRLPSLQRFWTHVLKMTAQIMVVMFIMALGLYLLVQWGLPAV